MFAKHFLFLYNELGDIMNTVKEDITYQKTIEKSKFIAEIRNINAKKEMDIFLEEMKKKWPNATHYVYAYRILPNDIKASDDGEPSKTAGFPILNVLEKKELNNIGCIVIRYFGGIKLGTGGLVRAYTNTVVEALEDKIISLIPSIEISFLISYENWNNIQKLPELQNIIQIEYKENIFVKVKVEKEKWNSLQNKINTYITNLKIENDENHIN